MDRYHNFPYKIKQTTPGTTELCLGSEEAAVERSFNWHGNEIRILPPRSSASPLHPLFVLLGLLLAISGAEAQLWPTFIDHFCTNDTFSANSTYKRNLDTVLSALSSNTSDYVRGFTSVERGSSDRIYGLLLCRGDQSPDSCRACVLDGTQRILQRCPMDKGSTMWYWFFL